MLGRTRKAGWLGWLIAAAGCGAAPARTPPASAADASRPEAAAGALPARAVVGAPDAAAMAPDPGGPGVMIRANPSNTTATRGLHHLFLAWDASTAGCRGSVQDFFGCLFDRTEFNQMARAFRHPAPCVYYPLIPGAHANCAQYTGNRGVDRLGCGTVDRNAPRSVVASYAAQLLSPASDIYDAASCRTLTVR